jgi:hypothetical protein
VHTQNGQNVFIDILALDPFVDDRLDCTKTGEMVTSQMLKGLKMGRSCRKNRASDLSLGCRLG